MHPHPTPFQQGVVKNPRAKDSDGKQAPDLPLPELTVLPGHVQPHFFKALIWAGNCV